MILRRPLWEKISQQVGLPLMEGAAAPHLYDKVAELMHGDGARFPIEAQKQVEQTADNIQRIFAGTANKSPVLAAFLSVLLPSSFSITGTWGAEETQVAIVPDDLSPRANKDSRLLFVAFRKEPLSLNLEIFPEDPLFQAARPLTGAQDIQSGHAELDARAVLRGDNEERVMALLAQPDVLPALLKLIAHEGKFLVNDRGVFITVAAASLVSGASRELLDSLVEVVQQF